MPHTIAEKIRKWSRGYEPPRELDLDLEKASDDELEAALEVADTYYPSKYERLESQIDYLAMKLYSEYEVTKYPPYLEFQYRLRDWLDSAPSEDDQKILFELVPRLFFIGNKEYLSLYQSALNGPVARWLISQLALDINKNDAQSRLQEALSSTWFCPITDSMQISKFYHVNQIEGADLRPDWRTLDSFCGSHGKIVKHMKSQSPPLERIVLLEDFVATGSQMKSAVEFAVNLPDGCPVLLCPLVICPSGYTVAKQLEKDYVNLKFEPALMLDQSIILPSSQIPHEDSFISRLREVILRTYSLVVGSNPKPLYGPFGFGEPAEGGGLLLIMYTNCPDNTLPMIHHASDSPWNPIFPRSSRL